MAFRNQETILTLPDGAGDGEPRIVIDGELGQIRVYTADGLVALVDSTGIWAIDPSDQSNIRMAYSPTEQSTQLTFNPGIISGRTVDDAVLFTSITSNANVDRVALDLFSPELDISEATGRALATLAHFYDKLESAYLSRVELSAHRITLNTNTTGGHPDAGSILISGDTDVEIIASAGTLSLDSAGGGVTVSADTNVDLQGIGVRGATLNSNGLKPVLLGESGVEAITWVSVTSWTFNFNFAHTYDSPPAMSANFATGAGSAASWNVRAINITTTGFTLFGWRVPGQPANSGTDIPVTWIATVI